MSTPDKDLHEFFSEMRKADEQLDVPDFEVPPKKRQPITRYFLPLGIAASLLIIISTYLLLRPEQAQVEPYEIVITIGNEEGSSTQPLIEPTSSIDSWTSPTGSLIADF